MATQAFQTDIVLNVAQYLATAQQQIQAMGGQAAGIVTLTGVTEKFNAEGKVTGAVIKALTNDYKELTVQITKATKAQQEAGRVITNPKAAGPLGVKGASITQAPLPKAVDIAKIEAQQARQLAQQARAQQRLADDLAAQQARAIAQANAAATAGGGQRIRTLFPGPQNGTIDQIVRYEAAIQRVQTLLARGKISGTRFDEIFNAVKAGGTGLGKLGALSGDEQKLISALGQISKGFADAKVAQEKFGAGHINAFRITEALLFKEAISGLVVQIQRAIFEAVEFQIKISQIRTLSTENQASFNAWSESIERVSNALGLPAPEVAKAAYEALSSQIVEGKEQTEKFIKTAGELARVGVSDIAQSGKLLSAIFNAYSISAERAEEVSAKLFVAVDRGNFTVGDLAGNFGRVSTTAAALGVSLDEVLASLTTLTRQGVNSSDAQTQLLNVFLKLQNPTGATTKFLKNLGFETGQAAIEALGFVGVLEQIEKATKGDIATLSDFGGELRAIRGLIGLTTRGKGGEFQEDLRLLTGKNLKPGEVDPATRFKDSKAIRGESAGDQLTIEFTKVKNFFVNDFGQSIINTVNNVSKEFGGMFNVIKSTVNAIELVVTVLATYKIASTAASFATSIFSSGINKLATLELPKVEENLTKAEKATKNFQSAMSAVVKIVAFATILDQIIRVRKEMDDVNKKSKEYENIVSRIKAQREGKSVQGESLGAGRFESGVLEDSSAFANAVDKVYRPLLAKQALAAREAQKQLSDVQERGKETSLQLAIAFKSVTDSINDAIKNYADNIRTAEKGILDSKKALLGIKDTVQDLIFDLKLEFANDQQKIILREQEIRKLTGEALKLLRSDAEEDVQKGTALSTDVLKKIKENASAKIQAEIEATRLARRQSGRADNSPILVNTQEAQRELQAVAKLFADAQNNNIRKREEEVKVNEKLIETDKERARLLAERSESFLKLTPRDADGAIKSEFQDPATGKFDQARFASEFDKRSKLVTDLLKTQEEKDKVSKEFEAAKLNLLQQQSAEIDLQLISQKQLQTGQKVQQSKAEFENAAKKRLEASRGVEKAGAELDASSDIIRGFLDQARSDSSIKTIGEGENSVVEFGQRLVRGIADGINAVRSTTGQSQLAVSEREEIAIRSKPQIDLIIQLQQQLAAERQKLTARDANGVPLGTQENVDNIGNLRQKIFLELGALVGRFNKGGGALNTDNFAVPGQPSLGELNSQMKGAVQTFQQAISQERQQVGIQNKLARELTAVDPNAFVVQEATRATAQNTEVLLNLNTGLKTYTEILKTLNPNTSVAPANIAPVVPPFGKHHGGMISGPSGYDNLLIRAEAGEFVMSQVATKKWLPQLIEMNKGRNPKIPGHYHEGGLVQTNVGDVNVTISGPSTPDRTVREIGKGIQRLIRRGDLNLPQKKV